VSSGLREGMHWLVGIQDMRNGKRQEKRARLLVNAAGPWVDEVLANTLGNNGAHNVRLVQGSHIVIRRRLEHGRAYFFQNADSRIIFAIPYEDDFTLIGTTDLDYVGDPQSAEISQAEITYLLEAASEYFMEPVRQEEIAWAFSGVRPLFDDGATKAQEATRDYVLRSQAPEGAAPLINIFGGKLTTYRRLAEAVLERIEKHLGRKGARWTANARLPGGDFQPLEFDAQVERLRRSHPFLETGHARRLTRLYGTRADMILGEAESPEALGRCFGANLYEAEIRYLMAQEWAETAQDVLWRRSKLGLRLTEDEVEALEEFMRSASRGNEAAA
jgi:glycerol-3-phosphate dehydrogenase